MIWDWVCPCASCKFPGKKKHAVLLGRKLTKTPPIRWKSDLESLQSLPLKETCTSLCTFRWWIFQIQQHGNTPGHGWFVRFFRSQCCFTQKEVKLYEVPMVELVGCLLTKKNHGLGGEIFPCVFLRAKHVWFFVDCILQSKHDSWLSLLDFSYCCRLPQFMI